MVRKAIGALAADLVNERKRAAHAEHAARRRIVAAAVAVIAITTGAALVFVLAPDAAESPRQWTRAITTPTYAAEAADPTLTARGTLAKRIGEIAGFGSATDPDQNTFVINNILVDPPCALGRTRSASQHTIVLYVTAHTGADARRAGMLGRILTPGFFEAIGPDGRRYYAWPGECTDPIDALPDDFGPNRDYSGTIELRLPIRRGTLILSGVMTNAAGWEWRF